MSSHPHFTGQCRTQGELSKFMQVVNTRFALAVNKFYGRWGQAIRDRFVSPQIKDDENLRRVMAYIDLNPVRSKIVKQPPHYHYCSYRHYAFGEPDPLLDPCPAYEELGDTPKQRQAQYRKMVEAVLEEVRPPHTDNHRRACFIGDPEWVKTRYEKLLAYERSLRLIRNNSATPMRR
jgi:putative transposase